MGHCMCVEVQRITLRVGSLLPSLYRFFLQVTKHAGHMALCVSHLISLLGTCLQRKKCYVQVKPVNLTHLKKKTKKQLRAFFLVLKVWVDHLQC